MRNNTASTVKETKTYLDDLEERVVSVANTASKKTKELSEDAAQKIGEQASEVFDQAKDYAISGKKNLEKMVKKDPTNSLLIAAGVGFGLGLFFGRR